MDREIRDDLWLLFDSYVVFRKEFFKLRELLNLHKIWKFYD